MPPKDVIIEHTACRQINMISLKAWSIYNNCCWTCYLIRLHWPRMKQSFCGLHIWLSRCAYTFCCSGLSTVCPRKRYERQWTCLNITEGLCLQVLQHVNMLYKKRKGAGWDGRSGFAFRPFITLSVQVSEFWPCVLGNDVAFIICKKEPATQKSHALHPAQVSAICQA